MIDIGFGPSLAQARDSGGNTGTTHNKYVAFFSCMDEKSDIDIGLNKAVVPKNKQGSYRSKDSLYCLKLVSASLGPMFAVAFHLISSHDGMTDCKNQTKHYGIQEVFVNNIAKIEEA